MRRTDSGSAMILVIIISISLFSLALVSNQSVQGYQSLAEFYQVERNMRYMADSGANNAINTLRNDPDLWQLVIDDNTYVEVYNETINGYDLSAEAMFIDAGDHLTPPYSAMDMVHLRCTATHGAFTNEKTTEYLFKILTTEDLITPFTNAMFANESYTFMGSAKAGYFDSAGEPIVEIPTVLASNGTVSVKKPGNVDGNVESEVDSPMPEVSFQPEGINLGDITAARTIVGGADAASTISYQCRDVDDVDIFVKGYAKLYVAGNWGLTGKNGSVTYDSDDARLMIIHQGDTGNLDLNGNDQIGNPAKPSQFIFMTNHSGDIKFNGNGIFGGVYLAPQATVSMNGTFDMTGAISAESFDTKVNGTFSFTFDTQLSSLEIEVPVITFADFAIMEYMTR